MKKLCIALLLLGLVGCSTVGTRFEETVTDVETGESVTTIYKARSVAGPLGEIFESAHNFMYRWGGAENEVTVGQESEGIDNTQQALMLNVFGQMIEAIADAYSVTHQPVPNPGPSPGDLMLPGSRPPSGELRGWYLSNPDDTIRVLPMGGISVGGTIEGL